MKTLETVIKDNPWFSPYLDSMPDILKPRLELLLLDKGKTVIRKGFEHPYIYFLISGSFIIQNEYYNGRNFSYAEQNAPGFCGLLEYFSGQLLPTSTIKTSSNVVAIRMNRSDFGSWIENDFRTYRMFAEQFARQMYPTLANQCAINAYSKKRLFINQIVDRFGDDILRSGNYSIPIKREEFAMMLGTSVRTVYRLEEELRNAGMISIDNRKITVDVAQLRRLEEFQASDEL